MSFLRLHLLPFSLLSVLASAQSNLAAPFSNSSSSSSSSSQTRSACDHCTVTAYEIFHSYTREVEIESITATNVVVPMVTVHPDGRLETNYITETQSAVPTAPGENPAPQPTDPFETLTWEPYSGVTLTYPTTYVEFFDLSGGTFYPVEPVIDPTITCTFDDQPLALPTNSRTSLLIPVPSGIAIDPRFPQPISAPPRIHSYLNGIPAVSSQFAGTDVAKCAWTKLVAAFATTTTVGAFPTLVPSVQKVSVSVLTEVTARQVIITAPSNQQPTAAIPRPEQPDTVLIVPPGNTPPPNNNNNNPPAQNQQQGTPNQNTAQNLGVVIAQAFDPAGTAGTQGTAGAGGAGVVNGQAVPTAGAGGATGGTAGVVGATGGTGGGSNGQSGGGATGANGQSGGSGNAQGTGTAGTVNGQSGGQGGQANSPGGSTGSLPAPLVIVVGGQQTSIAPTIIRNPDATGSVTAFVLGPGSTLIVGGAPITVSGSAISAPPAGTTGGVGGAIASGLGYTGPLASDSMASSIHEPNLPLWIFGAAAGAFGALAVGL